MKTKIVVTGGSGFIGTNLVRFYMDKGMDVVNIDIAKPKLLDHQSNWVNIDILDKKKISDYFQEIKPTHVVHLAARTDLQGKDLTDYASNIEGVENVISAINDCGSVVKTIFASSMLVCKVGCVPTNYDEYLPSTIYGESKVSTEKIIKTHPGISCEWTIVRPTSIWGPWFGEPYRNFFELVINGRYANFYVNACTKTYGYIGNTVFQLDNLLFACSSSSNNKVFYLGDIPPINISEWADEIRLELNLQPSMKVPFFIFKLAALCGDVLSKFGYKFPMTSFRLKNMTTDNVLNLDDLYGVVGIPPYNRKEGILETLKWFSRLNNNRD